MELCTHCNTPIEEYGSKKDKICKPCYVRMMNAHNRGQEYTMVKDLPENERTKIFNRRNKSKNVNKVSHDFHFNNLDDNDSLADYNT